MVKEKLFIVGVPGTIGGASTKIRHLLVLLRDVYDITVVMLDQTWLKNKDIQRFCQKQGASVSLLKHLPSRCSGTALVVCEPDVFITGGAAAIKRRGLKLVFSNDMMWEFKGEASAASSGLIDRVIFVSEFQQAAFDATYTGVQRRVVGNYIDPVDFPFSERRNPVFTIGRLSRPDQTKYPEDFPVFYEELGIADVRFRVMAWGEELRRRYKWHRFGPEWELLGPQKETAARFLQSLDLFLYPLGHHVKESWGRSTAEAMLTGCVPLVPSGHQFHRLMVHGDSGFICSSFSEYRDTVQELYENQPFRRRIGRRSAEHAREELFNAERHRQTWIEALTF